MKLNNSRLGNILVAGFFVLFLVSVATGYMLYKQTETRYTNELYIVDRDIASTQKALSGLEKKIQEAKDEEVTDITGISMEHVKKNKDVILDITKKLTTWNNYKEYENMRQSLMQKYNALNAESDIMKHYAPFVRNDVIQGKDYNTIDYRKLNTKFVDAKPYLLEAKNGIYRYFVIVEYKCNTDGSTAKGTTTMLFVFDTKSVGDNLKTVLAYTGDVGLN